MRIEEGFFGFLVWWMREIIEDAEEDYSWQRTYGHSNGSTMGPLTPKDALHYMYRLKKPKVFSQTKFLLYEGQLIILKTMVSTLEANCMKERPFWTSLILYSIYVLFYYWIMIPIYGENTKLIKEDKSGKDIYKSIDIISRYT